MQKAEPSVDRILELDLEFHNAIARTIQNPQIDTITSEIVKLTVPSRRETTQRWIASGQKNRFLELHRQIIDVIEKRDESRIDQAVADHYVLWK